MQLICLEECIVVGDDVWVCQPSQQTDLILRALLCIFGHPAEVNCLDHTESCRAAGRLRLHQNSNTMCSASQGLDLFELVH
eukprot:Skav216139  [mRNA]  locus=scaffold1946:391290:391967:+ [translate_table: standard]